MHAVAIGKPVSSVKQEARFVRFPGLIVFAYYEDIEPGHGYDLSVEVYSAIQRSVAYPRAWPVLDEKTRRALVRRFPYGVLLIVAVMNLHREPGYWKGRR